MGKLITPSMSYSGVDIRVYAVVHSPNRNIERTIKNYKAGGYTDQPNPFENPSVLDPLGVLDPVNVPMVTPDSATQKSNDQNPPVFIELAELQTLSYSVYRDKQGVNTLGRSRPKGFTRGNATIAGTMVFTVFHEKVLNELNSYSLGDSISPEDSFQNMRIDQLPPLDIFVTFANEVGNQSRLSIYGIEFMNEGQVMSVQDLITENSVNYLARHISPMRRVADAKPDDIDFSHHLTDLINPMMDGEYEVAVNQINALKKRWL